MTTRTPTPPPLDDALETLLRRMRLPHIRRAAPEVLATAKAQRWDPAEVLRVLLTEEVAGRDRSSLATRRARAAFPTGKTFQAWNEATSSIPAPTQAALRTLEWIGRAENLVVCGPAGTGKTFLLEALGQAAVEAGRHVAWFTLEALGVLVRRHRADDSVTKAITRILRADLVIVDDIGLLPVGPDAAEGLYRLVDAAYERRSASRSRRTCTRRGSTSSCPRRWPPPPSTGSCTTLTCARPAARACDCPKPSPAPASSPWQAPDEPHHHPARGDLRMPRLRNPLPRRAPMPGLQPVLSTHRHRRSLPLLRRTRRDQ